MLERKERQGREEKWDLERKESKFNLEGGKCKLLVISRKLVLNL